MHTVFNNLTKLTEVSDGVFVNDTHMLKVFHKNDLQDMVAMEGTVESLTGKTPELKVDFCKMKSIGIIYKGNFNNTQNHQISFSIL